MASSLFHQAVMGCRYVQAKLLLDQGVDINSQAPGGSKYAPGISKQAPGVSTQAPGCSTPLLVALMIADDQKRARMFRWLLKKGADPTFVDPCTDRDLLGWAAYLNRTEQVSFILDADEGLVNIHHQDVHGRTAMHYATMHDNPDALLLVVTHAAKFDLGVDIPDVDGLTPYLLASMMHFDRCAEILVQIGGAVTSQMFITSLVPTAVAADTFFNSSDVPTPKRRLTNRDKLVSADNSLMFNMRQAEKTKKTKLSFPLVKQNTHYSMSVCTDVSSLRSGEDSFLPALVHKHLRSSSAKSTAPSQTQQAYIPKFLYILAQQSSCAYRHRAVVTETTTSSAAGGTRSDTAVGRRSGTASGSRLGTASGSRLGAAAISVPDPATREPTNLSFLGAARVGSLAMSLVKKKQRGGFKDKKQNGMGRL